MRLFERRLLLIAAQAKPVLNSLGSAQDSRIGTMPSTRIAAKVQRLADENFPVHPDQAQEQFKVLVAPIDAALR